MESREICLVGDELTSTGFRLAGVRSYTINRENQERIYGELKDKKAVLILTQSASHMLGEKVEKLRAKSLVISIPEKEGDEYLSIRSLIKSTIGFDLKAH